MTPSLDTTPLTAPMTRAEVAEFRTRARSRPEYAAASPIGQMVIVAVALVFLAVMGASAFGFVVTAVGSFADSGPAALLFGAFPLFFVAVVIAVGVAVFRGNLRGGRWMRWARLDRFAAVNGLAFSPFDADPTYTGMIFGQGRARVALDHLTTTSGRFVDYGSYRYVTGGGKNSTTHTWGFLALELDRSLPHMVLDATANNGIFGNTIGTTFSKDQVLRLEGDFNEHFTLFCPREYERDALYVFTPDLMALAIDEAAAFDIEIVDRWMFVYSTRPFDLLDPAVHARLHRIVDTVGAKTLTQTDRYRDDRAASFESNAVAPSGQRLRRGVSTGAIVVAVVFLAVWGWPWISGLLALVTGR